MMRAGADSAALACAQNGTTFLVFSGPTPDQCKYKTEVGTLWAPGGSYLIMESPDSGATWSKPRVRYPAARVEAAGWGQALRGTLCLGSQASPLVRARKALPRCAYDRARQSLRPLAPVYDERRCVLCCCFPFLLSTTAGTSLRHSLQHCRPRVEAAVAARTPAHARCIFYCVRVLTRYTLCARMCCPGARRAASQRWTATSRPSPPAVTGSWRSGASRAARPPASAIPRCTACPACSCPLTRRARRPCRAACL